MYLDEKWIQAVEDRYGQPRILRLTQEISPEEFLMVQASRKGGRSHDITFFIFRGNHVALIRKPMFPPGAYRIPSGGLRPGESLEKGTQREAFEETGLEIEVERYLLRVHAHFTCGHHHQGWTTHVFQAHATGGELQVKDTREIAEVKWGTLEEVQGPIRDALLNSGRGLFSYRVALTDAAIAELQRLAGESREKY